MKKEIEIKLSYNKADRQVIKSLLEKRGAKFSQEFELNDIYFSQSHTDMSKAHDLLRIRNKAAMTELPFKGKCENNEHIWQRIEDTCKIVAVEEMQKILTYLNFKIISENKSLRETWLLNGVEIVFIDFILPEKISLIEIEGDTSEDVRNVIEIIADYVKNMGEDGFSKFDNSRNKN